MDKSKLRFAGAATPLTPVKAYGSIVPFRFTITNECPFPVFVERVKALVGYQRDLAVLTLPEPITATESGGVLVPGPGLAYSVRNGLLLPGQSFTFETEYRVVDREERLHLTLEAMTEERLVGAAWLPEGPNARRWVRAGRDSLEAFRAIDFPPFLALDPGRTRAVLTRHGFRLGEITIGGALANLPCPPAPFEPEFEKLKPDAWSFSRTLDGFVVRVRAGDYRLLKKTSSAPLPPVPFPLLDDLDRKAEGVEVRMVDGEVRTLTAPDLMSFLESLHRDGGRIRIASGSAAPYQVSK